MVMDIWLLLHIAIVLNTLRHSSFELGIQNTHSVFRNNVFVEAKTLPWKRIVSSKTVQMDFPSYSCTETRGSHVAF
jgi:hypothetical protein